MKNRSTWKIGLPELEGMGKILQTRRCPGEPSSYGECCFWLGNIAFLDGDFVTAARLFGGSGSVEGLYNLALVGLLSGPSIECVTILLHAFAANDLIAQVVLADRDEPFSPHGRSRIDVHRLRAATRYMSACGNLWDGCQEARRKLAFLWSHPGTTAFMEVAPLIDRESPGMEILSKTTEDIARFLHRDLDLWMEGCEEREVDIGGGRLPALSVQ